MKKIILCGCVGLCLLALSVPCYADYDDYRAKIEDGLIIMSKSPLILVDSIKEEYTSAQFKPFGVFGGFIKGSFYGLKEFSAGLYRVLTFNMDEDNIFTKRFK